MRLKRALAVAFVSIACGTDGPTPNRVVASEGDLDQQIADFGYAIVQPPSQLAPPGTLVVMTSTNPVQLKIVCSATDIVGHATAMTSPTFSAAQKAKVEGKFQLDATAARLGNLNVDVQHVKSLTLVLTNTSIIEIKDTDVNPGGLSPACSKAVSLRRGLGEQLTVIRSVLKADAEYSVQFDDTANAKIQESALKQLSLSLSASLAANGSGTLTGSGLYWGLRDDTLLVSLALGGFGGRAAPKPRPIVPPAITEIEALHP